jgi:hypothetical protein
MLSQPRVLDAGGGPLVPDVTGWVQSLAVARHSDLVASGAADGCVRLWEAVLPGAGSNGALNPVGALPARGFVNGLALGRSGRLVVAALGQVRNRGGGMARREGNTEVLHACMVWLRYALLYESGQRLCPTGCRTLDQRVEQTS